MVDLLITNFHLPQSTLMMLVSAFAGYEHIMQTYQTAIAQRYRNLTRHWRIAVQRQRQVAAFSSRELDGLNCNRPDARQCTEVRIAEILVLASRKGERLVHAATAS